MPHSRLPALGPAVALLTTTLMTTEIVVTRIFSVVVWYHFAFFAISVALFGAGVAAVIVHVCQRVVIGERTPRLLAWSAAALAASVIAVDVLLVSMPGQWLSGSSAGPFTSLTWKLLAVFGATAAPFAAGGFAICLVMTRYASDVHRLYFWDLGGAGAGCLLVVPLLGAVGGPAALVAAAIPALVATVLLTLGARRAGHPASWAPTGLAAAAVALGLATGAAGGLDLAYGKGIDLREKKPEWNRWNAFSMVTVFPHAGFSGWGTSPAYRGPLPEQKFVVIDLNAGTVMNRFDGRRESAAHTLFDLSALVYRVRPSPKEVCVVGAGGGRDVLAALAAGAGRVTAAEINPLVVNDVVRGAYRDFTGNLYGRPDVDVNVEDGRSFVRRTDRRFDVLLLSMVDTSAASAAGAYALTENSLYTADAFEDFLSRLTPDGILSVSTVSLEGLAIGARLVATARAAVERAGGDPSRSIAVLQTPWLGMPATLHDVLVKPSGFTAEEVQVLARSAAELRFRIGYLPGVPEADPTEENGWIRGIATARDANRLRAAMNALPMDVSAPTDERPFFFYQNRFRDFVRALGSGDMPHLFGNGLVVLAKVLVLSVGLVLVFLLLPLILARRTPRGAGLPEGGAPAWDLGYVSCLGVGFMFMEIGVLQRFTVHLGNPTYSLAVVLFVLLVAGAVGSRALSGPRGSRRRLVGVLLAAASYVMLLRVVSPAVFDATRALTPPGRAGVAALVLAPLGFLVGSALPAGLFAIAARAPSRIPWLWAVNSGTSVLGSVLATLVSLHAGIDASLAAGAGFYLAAAALAPLVLGPSAASPVPLPAGAAGAAHE